MWDAWNKALPEAFDGLDWDLEGNDDKQSPYNHLTPEGLHLVVDMSVALKQTGYIVSMVPAQSYLDVATGLFNRTLLNAYPEYHPEFAYHGLNCYSYILAAAPAGTFDMVIVQLYEVWSRANEAIQSGRAPDAYLQNLTLAMVAGWTVDFGQETHLRVKGSQRLQVAAERLVLGLSFGASNGKSLALAPSTLERAYSLSQPGLRPRGYAFWMIGLDYACGPWNGTMSRECLSSKLNDFLHIRNTDSDDPVLLS